MKKKLFSKSGETILELLASILIITLLFAALCEATAIAARINRSIDSIDYAEGVESGKKRANAQGFRYEDVRLVGTKHIAVTDAKKIGADEVLAGDPQVNVFSAMKKDASAGNSDPKFWYFEKQ